MSDPAFARRVAEIRRFNRFYTYRIGVLGEGIVGSGYSLAEGRVLFELAQAATTVAAELAGRLGLDPAYLSRILRRFAIDGLIERTPSPADRRQSLVMLTEAGRAAAAELDRGSSEAMAALLAPLARAEQDRLVAALRGVQTLLGGEAVPPGPIVLRPARPGDLGWVLERHAVLYAEEQGWSTGFAALTAEIIASYLKNADPRFDACWIAECDGRNVGTVMVVREDERTARLRLLLVEPAARGRGLGRMLVAEAIRFARQAGYGGMVLWTNHVLTTARRVYEDAGFTLMAEEPHERFGPPLIGQTWRLDLAA